MKINPVYSLGDIVYLKVGENSGIVNGIMVCPGHALLYRVTWSGESTFSEGMHYEIELTDEKPLDFGGIKVEKE